MYIYICRGSHTDEVICVNSYITEVIDSNASSYDEIQNALFVYLLNDHFRSFQA